MNLDLSVVFVLIDAVMTKEVRVLKDKPTREMILIVGHQETIKAGMFTCIVTTNTLHFNIGTTVSCVSYCVLRPSSNLSVGC